MPANASRADRSRENQSHGRAAADRSQCETKKRPVTVFSEQMRDQKRRNEANGGEYPALPAVRIRQETERRAAVISQYRLRKCATGSASPGIKFRKTMNLVKRSSASMISATLNQRVKGLFTVAQPEIPGFLRIG